MRTRTTAIALSALCLLALAPAGVAAAGPTIDRGFFEDTFDDEFILDLCGIETTTTVTGHFVETTFPNGKVVTHVRRTFVSADPRLPIERGNATRTIAPDGTESVVGLPIQLVGPNGGVRLLDAGLIIFTDPPTVRGPHPSFDADLADYYCP